MSNVPDGAIISEDGSEWWDGEQWQPVSKDEGAANLEADTDRAAARRARGLPDSAAELTDEQRKRYLAEPKIELVLEASVQVEVLAMEDVGNASGEQLA